MNFPIIHFIDKSKTLIDFFLRKYLIPCFHFDTIMNVELILDCRLLIIWQIISGGVAEIERKNSIKKLFDVYSADFIHDMSRKNLEFSFGLELSQNIRKNNKVLIVCHDYVQIRLIWLRFYSFNDFFEIVEVKMYL